MNDKRTTVSDERLTEAIEVVHRLDAALCNFLNGADDAYTPDLWHEETKRNFARLSEVYNDCHKAELMDLHGSPLLSALLTELQHRRAAEAGTPEGWVRVPRDLTLDMEQAHYDAHAKAETVFASAQEVWSAMLAASPSSPASGVRVKALEWSTDDYEDDVRAEWFAVCVVGQYLAYQRDGDWRLNLDYASGDEMIQVYIGAFETPDAAKAAAQTEYEARILSALGEHP